jgi:hypothetical protein
MADLAAHPLVEEVLRQLAACDADLELFHGQLSDFAVRELSGLGHLLHEVREAGSVDPDVMNLIRAC